MNARGPLLNGSRLVFSLQQRLRLHQSDPLLSVEPIRTPCEKPVGVSRVYCRGVGTVLVPGCVLGVT